MSHHFKRFFRSGDDYADDERLRLFIRRNRKKILVFLLIVIIIFVIFISLTAYVVLKLLGGTTQVISENRGYISQLFNGALSMIQKWGWLFGG